MNFEENISPIFFQDVICSKARCVNDGELWGKFLFLFRKSSFSRNTWYFEHSYHWSWWPGEVAKPWSRVNTSGLGDRPIRAHLDFKVKANCLKKHLETALRKSSPLVIVGSSHQNIGQAGLACWNKIGKHCFGCFGNFGWNPDERKSLTHQHRWRPVARSCGDRYFIGSTFRRWKYLFSQNQKPTTRLKSVNMLVGLSQDWSMSWEI